MADEEKPLEPTASPELEGAKAAEKSSQGGSAVTTILFVILALIALGALIWFLFFRGDDETAEIEPTLAPTAEQVRPSATEEPSPPPASTPSPLEDQVWARILEKGEMTIGVSADYPPFEYYNSRFQLDGFDVALIQEIAILLGLQVEFRDMAFDGLLGSLALNNIDVAISAISITSERLGKTAFSNIYFVSEDAVLANASSTINSIPSASDMAFRRVGVQSGSIYDHWLTTHLVETNIMPEVNLHRYQQAGAAVDDLIEGLIDIVVIDLQPAVLAVERGGVKLVEQGLNPQRFAIAVPYNAPSLLKEINSALLQLQASGRVGELVEEYIGIDDIELPPVPTPLPPQPSPTPEPEPSCLNDASFIQDLTYDDLDGTNPPQMVPGQVFQKGWRMRNSGTCTWDTTYSLVPAGGNVSAARMGGTPVFVQGAVAPGQTYDFWVDLVAPLAPRIYREMWTMRNTNTGILFGDKVWVMVEVAPHPTPTPVPTQTPSPQIIFFAEPTQITQGQSATLNWSTENAREVYLYPQGQHWEGNGVVGAGQRTVYPSQTTTYELRAIKRDGSVEIRTTTVFVTEVENAPTISRFTAEPNPINQAECVLLTWRVDGAVDVVNLYRENVVVWPVSPTNGSIQDCPPNASGQVIYSLEARGPGGTTWAQDNISVMPLPTATPIPTSPPQATATPIPPTATPKPSPTPPLPRIEYFAIEPGVIEVGNCVQVAWGVVGTVNLIQIMRGGVIVYDNAPFSGLEQDCSFTAQGTYVYSISASNTAGQSDSRTASVVVNATTPQNPLSGTQWQLVSFDAGQGVTPIIDNSTITTAFLQDYEAAGLAGCNIFSGQYLIDGPDLVVENVISGRLACPQPAGIMEQEAAFLSLLESVASYLITVGQGTQLSLLNEAGEEILIYEALLAAPF